MPVTSTSTSARHVRRQPPFAVGADAGTDPKVTDVRERLAAAYQASARRAREGAGQARRARASSTCATGSRCSSTRAASSRTAATPTRTADGLPADGVVTGRGTVDGRPAIVIANDPTVKAGSWGARTVEKIVRATEMALREELPVFWFVDSAGARITDQVELFPGRRGAGRIFHNQVALSGKVPQICCLFGPVGRRRRLHPVASPTSSSWSRATRRCTSAARGWPRWSSARRSRSRRWAARGCTAPSPACGDLLVADDAEAIELARLYFSYLPVELALRPAVLRAGGARRRR